MEHIIHYFSGLTSQQQAIAAICVVVLMAGMPYFGLVGRLMLLLLRRQMKAVVVRFDWFETGSGGSGRPFFVEDTTAILHWEVEGAYRIDVLPIGRRLKGNAAEVVIKPGLNRFVLYAYGLSGKAEAVLTLPTNATKQLSVAPMGRNISGGAAPKPVEIGSYHSTTKALQAKLENARFEPGTLHRIEPLHSRLAHKSFLGTLILKYRYSTQKYQKFQHAKKTEL